MLGSYRESQFGNRPVVSGRWRVRQTKPSRAQRLVVLSRIMSHKSAVARSTPAGYISGELRPVNNVTGRGIRTRAVDAVIKHFPQQRFVCGREWADGIVHGSARG